MNQFTTAKLEAKNRLERFLPTDFDNDDDVGFKISLSDLRTMLWRQRKVLVLVTLAILLLGLAVTFLMTPIYQAEATVKIDTSGKNILEGQDIDPVVSLADTNRYFNTQKRIIQSRNLAAQVVDALKLDRDDAFIDTMGGRAVNPELSASDRQSVRRDAVIGLLRGNVEMTMANESRIAEITFNSRDEGTAAKIANAYAERFIEQNVRERYDTNTYARKVLNAQVQETRLQLQATERQAIDYARRNRLIDTSDASTGADDGKSSEKSGNARSVTTANLVRLNESFISARARRIQAEARWRTAQATNGWDSPEGRTSGAVQSLIGRRADLATALADLRARYLDSQPEVQEKIAELGEVDRQLASVGRTIKSSLQSEFLAAQSEERQLSTAREDLAEETLTEQDRRVQLNLIARDAETQRRQLNDLLTRLNQVNSAADVTVNNISMLDRAQVPSSPISPNYRKNLMLALLAGMGLALLIAFAREALDDTLRSPDDVERKLHLPLLGTTPFVTDIQANDLEDRQGELSESYYSVRATIDYASSGAVNKVFLVTSSRPGEGKSTTAVALARDFARIGRKVLLVDADLRNPSLHKQLDIAKGVGLVDVLMKATSFAEARFEHAIPGLHVLPLGSIPANPVQLLSSDLFTNFIAEQRSNYDIILFDSAPVMGLADAPMLSRMVDFVVLIVEANRAHFGQAKSAVRRLQDAGATLLGVVMTKFSFRDAGYSYDYHYSYYNYRNKQAQDAQTA